MAETGEVFACHTLEDWNEKLQAARFSKKLIVIDFTATWCPPCRLMEPIFVEFSKKYLDVIFLKVDTDELSTVAVDLDVQAMPTFIFMNDGKTIDKVVGANKDELHDKLEKYTRFPPA